MQTSLRPVTGRKELETFIRLPERLHTGHTTWVPPLYLDERQYFDSGKNPAFSSCDTLLLLAWHGFEPVGRIMGIIHHGYNALRGEKTARFAFLECVENREVSERLLGYVENWARGKGMTRIVGPFGFSDQDPEGLLIEGFEYRATIVTACNFPWLPGFVEANGYGKEIDYVTYRIQVPQQISEKQSRLHKRICKRGGFEITELRGKRDVLRWVRPLFYLMNEAYTQSGLFGFNPLSEKEIDALAWRFLPIVDPQFIKLVTRGKELLGFVIGIPDITEGLQEAHGRLLPFGFLKILRAQRRTKQLDLLLGAVKDDYRRLGVDYLLGVEIATAALKRGMDVIDTHHVMEDNRSMRLLYENLGGEVYKRFRIYGKPL